MAKEFLNQHLKLENSIKSDDGQKCMICLEDCGSLSPETGIIECLIRLPCAHLAGSHCIATWLHANNTCPICRHEFFPAQPRPHLERAVIEDDTSDDDESGYDSADGHNDQDRLHMLANIVERFSRRLVLDDDVRRLSRAIARNAFDMRALRGCSRWARAAMYIFVGSHLVGRPVTAERLASVLRMPEGAIHDTYMLFYPARDSVIDRDCLVLLGEDPERATTGSLPVLAWPRMVYAVEW